MPVMKCKKNGRPGFKWGKSGVCYTYMPGNRRSINLAKQRALNQGRAIEANKLRKRR